MGSNLWIVSPAEDEYVVRKGTEIDVDVLMPCLEDGTRDSSGAKAAARDVLVDVATDYEWTDQQFYPRINHPRSSYWRDDVDALVPVAPDGIVLPKTGSVENVVAVSEYLREVELDNGLPEGSIGLTLMVETTRALRKAYDLATADPRVEGLLFGKEDYSADLRALRDDERRFDTQRSGLDYSRGKLAVDAAAAKVEAIDGPPFSYADEEYIFADSNKAARMGFTSKMVVHPGQIEATRRGFTPTSKEVERANEILELEATAHEDGEAAVGAVDDTEVTAPVVDQARLVVDRADSMGVRGDE